MADFIYNPKDPYYKSPFGALPSGSLARILVRVKREQAAFSMYFILQEDGQETQPLAMKWLGLTEDGWDEYEYNLKGLPSGLWWYWFKQDVFGDVTAFGAEKPWQLAVYDQDYATPEWLDSGVVYHIFVDRFNRVGPAPAPKQGRPYRFHETWGEVPDLYPEGQLEQNYDFFGGNLLGVIEKLEYLQSLGVRTIYLSPVFEAASNHRYDTGDYLKIDPIAGDEDIFRRLCEKAATQGMRVILDVAFNHTGSDSRYFNAKGLYDTVGAAQSADSPFFDWYSFKHWPDDYACWWGVKTLPQTNKENGDFVSFTLEAENSVVKHWLRAGASGFRLDVADELPQAYLEKLREAAKAEKPDAAVVGEVWEDATSKVSYGVRRRYFLGHELDGVTNYPVGKLVVPFAAGDLCASKMAEDLLALHENCPPPARRCLLNVVGSHDTPRILNVLGCAPEAFKRSKQEKASYCLSEAERAKGKRSLLLASALQYMLPGAPCLYYGDEAGMEGFEDPLNRHTYPWGGEDAALLAWYRALGSMRARFKDIFSYGSLDIEAAGEDVAIVRRKLGDRAVIATVNRGEAAYKLAQPQGGEILAGGIGMEEGAPAVPGQSVVIVYFERLE